MTGYSIQYELAKYELYELALRYIYKYILKQ